MGSTVVQLSWPAAVEMRAGVPQGTCRECPHAGPKEAFHHPITAWLPCLCCCLPCSLQEVALIGMTAYLAYLAGDVLGLSGILALFVCAVAISHYALHNISGAFGGWAYGGQCEAWGLLPMARLRAAVTAAKG